MLSAAKEALTTSLTVRTETDEPFELGKTQWNLGDLALARFVEQEVQHVAVLDDVALPSARILPASFARLLAAEQPTKSS
jgi:hypothetical protein